MNLTGQAALITGGASGLGAATARKLAKQGAKVALLDLNMTLAQEVAKEIGGFAIECNVADAASAEKAVAEAKEAHGAARILVNCAGIGVAGRIVSRDGPMDLDAFSKVININLVGSFNLMRLAAANMMELEPLKTENEAGYEDSEERGVIISTASVAAYEGQIGQSAYAASKGGIVSLTLPAAREFARFGIRVLAIAPGLFYTPLLANLPEEVQDTLGKSIPFPSRLGRADEYAKLVSQMIDNPYLNGEVIRLDGALRMPPR